MQDGDCELCTYHELNPTSQHYENCYVEACNKTFNQTTTGISKTNQSTTRQIVIPLIMRSIRTKFKVKYVFDPYKMRIF
jgi:hypothetical protein